MPFTHNFYPRPFKMNAVQRIVSQNSSPIFFLPFLSSSRSLSPSFSYYQLFIYTIHMQISIKKIPFTWASNCTHTLSDKNFFFYVKTYLLPSVCGPRCCLYWLGCLVIFILATVSPLSALRRPKYITTNAIPKVATAIPMLT